jgi:hypothetical protein
MSVDNHRQASEGAHDCILQCFGADAHAKLLTGIDSGGGCALVKKLYKSKGSIQHQMAKQDTVLERLTPVAMSGWPGYRDMYLEAMEARSSAVQYTVHPTKARF